MICTYPDLIRDTYAYVIITRLREAEETMYFPPLVVTYKKVIQDVRQENSTVRKGTNFDAKEERQHLF